MSPANGIDVTALKVVDGVAGAAGFASGAIAITASIATLPVIAPVVVVGAAVAGVTAGVWAIARSGYSLYDRARHSMVSMLVKLVYTSTLHRSNSSVYSTNTLSCVKVQVYREYSNVGSRTAFSGLLA